MARRQPDAVSRLASRAKVTGSQARKQMRSRVFAAMASMTFAPRAGARRIEKDEVGPRHARDPLLDRRVDELHVRRRVGLRAVMRDARALDRR